MPPEHDRPLLNPVLRLKMEAQPKTPHGGGKGRQSVVQERLATSNKFSRGRRVHFTGSARLCRRSGGGLTFSCACLLKIRWRHRIRRTISSRR